ncbi:MAG: winged helix-turn-helix domain-containing protein [Sphingorhabdus sp.]|uniref:winged helix-turn-helix domain-containing protein n=1 Tax=Sphingorhabdus sp. TaxID=1902408 RepID=UPI0038FCAC3A
MTIRISNREARRLWLNLQGLAEAPVGNTGILEIIKKLGFVQLDSIRNVTRAHHHILWSRNQSYREPMIEHLLAKERSIFEHFTHDASVLPMEYYPMWNRQFERLEAHVSRSEAYRKAKLNGDHQAIKKRIEAEGPLSTHAFDSKILGKKEMWDRPPHKRALDHMWYAGELATSHRSNFVKYYDLRERVIPQYHLTGNSADSDQIDWLCRGALDRLGFATPGEVQRFWGAVSAAEVRSWLAVVSDQLEVAEIETAAGDWMKCFAPANLEALLNDATAPTSRLRIINPFDPVARDRDRLLRLFGFDYRIEIFVPPAKRKWGYYVYPLLEGDRFVGRIEIRSDRKKGLLEVKQLWAENGVTWTNAREGKLDAELSRLARLVDAKAIDWQCSRQAEPAG